MHRIALCLAVLYCLSVSPTHGAEPIPEAAGPEDREQIPKLIQQLSDQRIPEDAFPYRETYGGYAMRALVNIGIEAVPALTAAVETTDAESRWLPVQGLKRIGPPARTALPVLIRNLDVDSWSLRSEITDSLAKIDRDGTTVIPSLKKMLRDENPYVRESAATGLGAYPAHAETGVPALIAALKDESPDVRAAAVVSLGKIGKPTKTITQSLLPLLHDRGRYALVGHDVVVQFDLIDLVASVLSKFHDQKQVIVPALLAAYHDEQLPSKTGIIDALVHFDAAAEPIVPDLIQAMSRLSTTKDVGRIHEPIVLAQLGKHASGAIPAARKLLRSGDGLAKLYAAGVLACIDPDSPPTAFEVLAQSLQEPNKNSDVTFDFLDVLGPEAEPLVPDLLTFLRRDKQAFDLISDARIFNTFRLFGVKAKPAIPSLIELYRSTLDEHEAQETFLAIGPAALDGLVKSLRGQTASPQIIRAIERFGRQAEETIPDLIVSMNDDDPETRQSIANALGSIRRNPTICLPALGRLLNDPHVAVRAAAAKSIGRFGRAAISAVPQLRAALSDEFVDVRVAAISALWNIGATDIETQQAVAKRVTDAHPLVQLVAKEWMEKFGSP